MVKTPTHDILTACGAYPRHAAKAKELLETFDGSTFAQTLSALCGSYKTHPGGAIFGLVGERGRGKTQSAVCAMASWYENKRGSVRYIRFAELCMRFRDSIKHGREIENLYELQRVSLLVIDEMDKRADTDHERRTLATLIDGRYGLGRWTVLIGNDSAEELMQAVGPTVGSRMNESGGVRVLDGKNYREVGR